MADDKKSQDIFRVLLGGIKGILQPLVKAFSDPESKAEVLQSLGLDPSKSPGDQSLPATNQLDQYVQDSAAEADPFALAGAIADLSQLVIAIEGVVQAIEDAQEGEGKRTANEIISALLNLLTLEFIRLRAPNLYGLIQVLNTIDTQAAASGGSTNFVEDTFNGYFKKLGSGFDTEDSTNVTSDMILLTSGGLLFGLDFLLKKFGNVHALEFNSGYGFETFATTKTPNADKISNRTLSFSVVNKETTVGNKANFTLVFVPEEQGGVSLVVRISDEFKFEVNLDETKKVGFFAGGDGIFRVGNQPDASLGPKNQASVAFLHRRDDAKPWSLLDSPAMKVGPGGYEISFTVTPDDLDIKLTTEILYQYGRGGKTGFPFDFLPENESGKTNLSIGFSLKKKFYVGSGSIGTSPASSGVADRSSAMPASRDAVGEIAKVLLNLLSLRIPLHKDIGGILGLETLYISSGVSDDLKKISLEASLDFWLKFGPPITISVSRLGLLIDFEKREDNGGLLGYNLSPHIKFPNGAGIRVNASVVTGGGFLYIDEPKGEYYGALQLSFKGLFDLKAVGIINTIMPDGTNGFSMFILITAEFSPIQLGFGFTLMGVGGMLGVNRGMDVEPIRVGLRTGAIRSVLFPEDVVGNIQRIISDIKQIFPIKEDSFVIGLMAKIGWGTPTLITAELGVMVELPDPKIVILGIIKCILPDENAALLKLQINFLGVIDFQNEFIYFEARLFESSVVGLTLTGSMAFVVAWGKNSTFGISVGGFHPDFKDYPMVPTLPGAFRDMDRIGIQLLSGDNPRLGVEAYFAITSNSVQFGAKAELYAGGPMGFNLYGMLAFDALFIFEPFKFIISLEATLAIRHNTSILFGLHFKGKLSGPRPWNVAGEVSFSVFPFVTITIGFDVTWGDPALPPSSATKDLVKVLQDEIANSSNWKVELPDYHNLYVSLREFDEVEQTLLIVHPFGQLIFSQRALPLDFEIQKFGEFKPLNVNKLGITQIIAGKDADPTKNFILPISDVKELFAAGNYTKLSEGEKLSRKSFETFNSGERLKDEGKVKAVVTPLLSTEVNYELDYTGDDAPVATTKADKLAKMKVDSFEHLRRNAGASKSAVSWSRLPGISLNSPEQIQLSEQEFFVVRESDMSAVMKNAQPLRAGTQSEAIQIMRAWEALNPDDVGALQVVEMHELV